MKAPVLNIGIIKEKLEELKGQRINMEVCRGRKQVNRYSGVLENTFACVFVVAVDEGSVMEKLSYSYSDILCGDVQVKKA
ncbi:MAG: Veg family protein [Firmicutes bacterium]|nr:Veg family protein [Bacillota bacterium]